MGSKKSGLGRGLGDILQELGKTYESQLNDLESITESEIENAIVEILVDEIDPNPYQPRKHFDQEKLEELSESIKAHGLIQPIVVIPNEDRYILIAGERRLRASKIAGLDAIKAIVAPFTLKESEKKLRELSLIENIQREDLNPIELALSYKELIEVHNITHEELAKIVHKSRSQITNTLRLLNLSKYTQEKIIEGKLSQGHAKVLLGLDEKDEKIVVDTIIGQKLSVRETEELIKSKKEHKGKKEVKKSSKKDLIDKEIIKELKELLPFKVKFKKSSVEICFESKNEIINFINLLKK